MAAPEITSPRQHAMRQGMSVYAAKKPCAKCGTHQRYTANGACIACQEVKKQERLRDPDTAKAYRRSNRERVAAWRQRQRESDI